MRTEIAINGSTNASERYICWAASPAQVRLADADGATSPVTVTLRNQNTAQGGQVLFWRTRSGAGQRELQLSLPPNGSPVDLFVGGEFGRPSMVDRDAAIQVIDTNTGTTLSVTQLMVRIRKNANLLRPDERDRFISAFATLNNGGLGQFSDFRNIHTNDGDLEAHRNFGFLPWHRCYLLDLERELQRIDPSVTLPYWKFDEPAPNLFRREFIGFSDVTSTVDFSPANPLVNWATDGTVPGVDRRPLFNSQTSAASGALGPVATEQDTIQTLAAPDQLFAAFRRMEGQPHGPAHRSFEGSISRIHTAAKDPLFFLLHTNVDRLWAKWQWATSGRRFDITSTDTYTHLGKAGDPGAVRIGHNFNDTMWPWNQIMGDGVRPDTAPGGTFPDSSITNAPGLQPIVGNFIDYQGVMTAASRLGFDYDDVPFELV